MSAALKPEKAAVTETKVGGWSEAAQSTAVCIIDRMWRIPHPHPTRGGGGAAPYHDGIAGPGGQIDVVGVRGDSAVPPLDVARHILTDALDALAGAVGTWSAHGL